MCKTAKSCPLSQSNIVREESTFDVFFFFSLLNLSPALCLMISSPCHCLHSLSLLCLSPICQEAVLCHQHPSWPLMWSGPPCKTRLPQALKLPLLSVQMHAFPSFFYPTNLPFMISSAVPSWENLRPPFPPTPRKNWVFPSLCSQSCEETAGTEHT